MGTGPRARSGFDLALTELVEDGRAFYVVESGSSRGAEILAEIEATPASSAETEAATRVTERTGSQMGRQLDTRGLPEMLAQSHHHRRWDEVARRCLACGNCTQVCPTCFCATVGDHLDLSGVSVERQRRWDSCFALDFSYIHGGSVRPSIRARYRQWLTHKLGTWHAQFGRSGCVGCGRCITWCPAAIDLTEEIPALRRGGTSPAPS
jgi:ferredoxin